MLAKLDRLWYLHGLVLVFVLVVAVFVAVVPVVAPLQPPRRVDDALN